MSRTAGPRDLRLDPAALDGLMPLHLWVDGGGRVVHAGKTIARMASDGAGGAGLAGRGLFDILNLKRSTPLTTMADLTAHCGCRLRARLRAHPDLALKAMAVMLPGNAGAFLNLSPGAALVETVGRFALTLDDFAPTDLSAEMLFLIEAKSAAFRESRRLNERLHGAKAAAETQAMTDTLTGLFNRRAADRALERLTHGSRNPRFGLMHVDLDHFKEVNDSLGHAAGDALLQHAAGILREETRKGDVVARMGGDEFLLILHDCDSLDLMGRIAARIIARLEQPYDWDGRPCRVSASIGTTLSRFYDPPVAERMLADADEATYRSKFDGRGRHTPFRPEAGPPQ